MSLRQAHNDAEGFVFEEVAIESDEDDLVYEEVPADIDDDEDDEDDLSRALQALKAPHPDQPDQSRRESVQLPAINSARSTSAKEKKPHDRVSSPLSHRPSSSSSSSSSSPKISMDDFIRNFLLKFQMHKTLDTFQVPSGVLLCVLHVFISSLRFENELLPFFLFHPSSQLHPWPSLCCQRW